MTTGKIIALNRWTLVGKVMSLLFNMLSRFVIAFLPRIKCLLISRLQSLFRVILEPKKINSLTISIVSIDNSLVPNILARSEEHTKRRNHAFKSMCSIGSLRQGGEEGPREAGNGLALLFQ